MARALPPLPGSLGAAFEVWARAVEAQLSAVPPMSVISTTGGPNASGLTGDLGAIAIDIGSSATRLWQKHSASTSTTGWSALSWI